MLRIAILGRPNVGKSSIFNRLCKQSLAIVNEEQGTTRDRLYGNGRLWDFQTRIIDTGGIDDHSSDHFQKNILKQALMAVQEADILMLVTDIRCGVTEQDSTLAHNLLKLNKPIILITNKADTISNEERFHEFYSLGIKNMIAVSAAHGKHISDLVDLIDIEAKKLSSFTHHELPSTNTLVNEISPSPQVIPCLNIDNELELSEEHSQEDSTWIQSNINNVNILPEKKKSPAKIAFIGRPNVGKSSLINSLLNQERCIIDNIPGTTRDNIDISFSYDQTTYTLIDTAGLRKPKSIHNPVEWISSTRAEKAIARADICLLIIDAQIGLSSYDKRILSIISEKKKSSLIILNKWDLIHGIQMEHYLRDLKAFDQYVKDVPILCVSAHTKKNVRNIFPRINVLQQSLYQKIPTSHINKVLSSALQKHHPQVINGRRLRIYYALQTQAGPPVFRLFINAKSLLTKSYEKYLKNVLKDAFKLTGIPFEIDLKEKPKRY